jgi:membrane protein
MKWLHTQLMRFLFYREFLAFTQRVSFPGFRGESVYNVMHFFFKQVLNEDLTMRSSALAFSFFLALFPAIIFLFTLIPFIPIDDTKDEVLKFFGQILDKATYESIKVTINDILRKKHGGVLSFGFFLAMYFASNGFFSLMQLFNKYSNTKETRTLIKQRLVSIFLALFFSVLIIISVMLITVGEWGTQWLVNHKWIKGRTDVTILTIVRWIISAALFFTTISSLFYFAPSKSHRWKFISTGATLAAILSMISTVLFSYYVNNFASYNKLYGSIGTLIVVLLLIQFNCMIIQIGFELNVGIENAVRKHRKDAEAMHMVEQEEEKRKTPKNEITIINQDPES